MVTLDEIIEFYKSDGPSKITWTDILNYLKTNCPHCNGDDSNPEGIIMEVAALQPFFTEMEEGTGKILLHYHFRSQRITGLDDDEIEIVRWILEHFNMIGPELDAAMLLGAYDDNEKTSMHYLFESSFRQISYSKYIDLIMMAICSGGIHGKEIVVAKRRKGNNKEPHDSVSDGYCCCAWNELMTNQSDYWKCTPLHYIADNPDIDYNSIVSVVQKCNQSWECHHVCMDDSSGTSKKERYGTYYGHPLLQRDREGEIPLCYIFARDKGDEEDDCQSFYDKNHCLLMGAFLGFVDCDYKITYDGAFEAIFSLLDSFCDKHEKSLNEMYQSNMWWSAEERKSIAIQLFLCSRYDLCHGHVVVPDHVHACLVHCFWKPMCILLQAAFKSNLHFHKNKHNCSQKKCSTSWVDCCFCCQDDASSEPVHLAASVPNFPAYVLQLTLLMGLHDDTNILLYHDKHGRIPLHYAILSSSSVPAIDKCTAPDLHEEVPSLIHWNSEYESRSIVQYILDHEPNAANIPDGNGRLPIHLAIVHHQMAGKVQSYIKKVLYPIVSASPIHISSIDPWTNLKPFMLAAAAKGTMLDVVYFLLRSEPSVLYE